MQYNNATTLKDRGGFFQGLLDELSGLYQSGDLGVNKTTAKNLSNYSTQKIPDVIASQVQGITAPYRKGLLNTPQAFLDMLNEGARTLGADIKDYEPMPIALTESEAKQFYDNPGKESRLAGWSMILEGLLAGGGNKSKKENTLDVQFGKDKTQQPGQGVSRDQLNEIAKQRYIDSKTPRQRPGLGTTRDQLDSTMNVADIGEGDVSFFKGLLNGADDIQINGDPVLPETGMVGGQNSLRNIYPDLDDKTFVQMLEQGADGADLIQDMDLTVDEMSALSEIFEEVQGRKSTMEDIIPNEYISKILDEVGDGGKNITQSLLKEIRKYKSADEFLDSNSVKTIGTPGGRQKNFLKQKVQLKDLKLHDSNLKLAEETFKKNPDFKVSSGPIQIGLDINTGEMTLFDGYHRYVKKNGDGLVDALVTPLENGEIINLADIWNKTQGLFKKKAK